MSKTTVKDSLGGGTQSNPIPRKRGGEPDYRRDFGGEVVVGDSEYHPQDDLQTPPYALAALDPFLPAEVTLVWEPASGEGMLAQAIRDRWGVYVLETGIEQNFFEYDPSPLYNYDVQITNPPWGKKYKWLEHSLRLRQPFALLLPSKMIFAAKAIHMIENSDLEIIQIYPRVGYLSTNMTSFLQSRPQLDSCWVTWGLQIGRRLSYACVKEEKKRFLADLRAKEKGQMSLRGELA